MPELPLLILPQPTSTGRRAKSGGGDNFRLPGRGRQGKRLAPEFTRLQDALAARRAELRTDTTGVIPEEVVVLEVVGAVEDFIRAVQRIDGLEWLGEIEEEDIPPDNDFFARDTKGKKRKGKSLRGRLFLIFSNQQALDQILSLWKIWQRGRPLPGGYSRWKDMFSRLRGVRRWDVRDRLEETGILEDWKERLAHSQETAFTQIELWFRRDADYRRRAEARVRDLVAKQGGQVVASSEIVEIGHHALLVSMPAAAIGAIIKDKNVDLVQCEQVQFFRAAGQMSTVANSAVDLAPAPPLLAAAPHGSAVAAIFDGMPLQNHAVLAGRLTVDDPQGIEAVCPVKSRVHGTAMASTVIWGDLSAASRPIASRVYVRPILRPTSPDWLGGDRRESVPDDVLVEDVLHQATRRLFEPDGDDAPAAPSVRVINLSIGIADRPFHGALSPLARLLDWLAWQYKVLFIVSAGNHNGPVELEEKQDPSADPTGFQDSVLRSVASGTRHRSLLSPAETINGLTIGAENFDATSTPPPPRWIDPFVERGMPSVVSRHGMGYRRGVKPNAGSLSIFLRLVDRLRAVAVSSPAVPLVVAHLDLDVSWITPLGPPLGEDQDVQSGA